MSELLQLPVDGSVSFDNGSYKNPGRLVMRTKQERIGWSVYYCMADGRFWWIGDTDQGSEGTAAVFGVGREKQFGVNHDLAERSGGQARTAAIHDASHFYIFAVSPDGSKRSRVHRFHNDKYVPAHGNSGPPWKLQPGRGVPDKVNGKRGIFDRYVDLPPDYEPGGFDPPDEPAPDPGPEDPARDPDDLPSLIDTVRRVRARYGTPLTNAQTGELLNAVALEHPGWGLARKPTGARTQQPQTGIDVSRDLLIHRATGHTFDVLADVQGEARPTWNYIETGILDWVAPVEPAGQGGGDDGPDVPEPVPPPDQPEEPDDPSEPEVPDDPQEPEPTEPEPEPLPEPRFSLVHAPPEVEAGELFRITWAAEDATHVELDNSRGPVAHDLAVKGSMNARLDANETYVLKAVNGRLFVVERLQVAVRPRSVPWWQRLLEQLFGGSR